MRTSARSSGIFGSTSNKKKKEEVDALNSEIALEQTNVENLRANIAEAERLAGKYDAEVKVSQSNRDARKKEEEELRLRNEALAAQIAEQKAEVDTLHQRLQAAKIVAEKAKEEKVGLQAEVVRQEDLIRDEHEAAARSAAAATAEAADRRAQQEAERRQWEEVRATHEDLRRKVDAETQRCEAAKAEMLRAKTARSAAQEELRFKTESVQRLKEAQSLTKDRIAEQEELKRALEAEIQELGASLKRAENQRLFAEQDHKQRQFVLSSVSDNLSDKRVQIQQELGHFQERFGQIQRAKLENPVEQG